MMKEYLKNIIKDYPYISAAGIIALTIIGIYAFDYFRLMSTYEGCVLYNMKNTQNPDKYLINFASDLCDSRPRAQEKRK